MSSSSMPRSHRVAYFYEPEVGNFYYGSHHPMKPYRLAITHELILKYGLYKDMDVYRPRRATRAQLEAFHSPKLLDFLYSLDTEKGSVGYTQSMLRQIGEEFGICDDCPAFPGLPKFFEIFSGASIQAAEKLNEGYYDIAINWSGGLHHAHKNKVSGFCYINDIVLAILELLKYHPRVLYIDIDVHHGDGVQDAFYLTDRVMVVSFHKYGNSFFPGTGSLDEIGMGPGKYCTVNVPLKDGIDDTAYHQLFKPIIKEIVDTYRPTAIVLQCGADSLKLDRIGCFNLSHAGHGECVRYVTSLGIPTLVLGGGGYTVRNVTRAWTYETGVICGRGPDLAKARIPDTTDYYQNFGPDYMLLPQVPSQYENKNTRVYLDQIMSTVLTNVRKLQGAPSVTMKYFPSPSLLYAKTEAEEKAEPDPDVRSADVEMTSAAVSEKEFIEDNDTL